MTKANEIAILRTAIEQLGPDSYCGPWLASVLDEVEATIRADYFPTMTISLAEVDCRKKLEAASENAKGIIEVAKADAKKISDRAQRYQDSVAEALLLALRNLNAV